MLYNAYFYEKVFNILKLYHYFSAYKGIGLRLIDNKENF